MNFLRFALLLVAWQHALFTLAVAEAAEVSASEQPTNTTNDEEEENKESWECPSDDKNGGYRASYPADTYDYIVVGAGAGGGVVASRLAQAGYETLLLDAGPDYNTDKTKVPLFWPYATAESQVEWAFRSRNSPDPGRDNVLYPRGSMIGGSTMHNAMISLYSFPDFWDTLRTVTGDDEFAESKMRKRFIKIERNEYRPKHSKGHGYDGYIRTSLADIRLLTSWDFLDKQLIRVLAGIVLELLPYNPMANFILNIFSFPDCLPLILDVNAPGFSGKEGAHIPPVAISRKEGYTRSSVYDLIKATKYKTHKLKVKPNSFVTKILLAERTSNGKPTAYGVEVQVGQALYGASTAEPRFSGPRRTYFARKEIILGAGVFNTPQTLMLSGIGPVSEVEKFGIRSLVDLPGVGFNLRDKLEATLNFKVTKDWKVFQQGCTFRLPTPLEDPCFVDFINEKFPNVYTTNGLILSIQKKSDRSLAHPDLYIQIGLTEFKGYEDGWVPTTYAVSDSLAINISTPRFGRSTGTVKLRSADPFEVVDIDFNGYDDEDLVRVGLIVTEIREFARGLTEKGYLQGPTFPGPEVDTLDEYKAWIRSFGWGHHPLGTAKMGADHDDMAVVNGQFQVRGVNNLRIVDASVFPDQPGFFPTIPIYMIGEKASEDIMKSDMDIDWQGIGCRRL